MDNEPIRRRKLSHEVLDRLLARITRGEFAPGEHLPSERDLMNQYQVGRPAVREAMQALERMGFITITHGERARIVAPTARTIIDQVAHAARHLLATSPTTLQQLKEARLFFETGIVRMAAARATDADIARLKERLDEHRAAAATQSLGRSDYWDEFLQKDMAFHREIAVITGNSIYVALSQAIFEWLAEFHVGLVRLKGAEALTIQEHTAIFERIAARDVEGAAEAMTRHLSRANELYRQFERTAETV
ncbi:transcriptional regulator NanR [Benzoatithermus flavus]|uniref:Transcriptional regulator NanR n=1 Tax=Benzoatithermus flavus TaxID=3108223 RepID=A0ABU8XYX2_9PROT